MALDRQKIERKDFPIGRRGYDPDAVDTHLSSLADEIDELKRSARRRTETLAATASEQVRAIVEAAENSAAAIQRQAEDDAHEIRTEASSEARATREHATAQARHYVGRVSESTAAMVQRLHAMQAEIDALIDALKTGGNRLHADLQMLERNVGDVRDAVGPWPRVEPQAQAERPEAESAKLQGDALQPVQETAVSGPAGESGSGVPATGSSASGADAPGNGVGDDESARFVALNMALSGSTREETERYLSENFHVRDQRALIDDVYASVGG